MQIWKNKNTVLSWLAHEHVTFGFFGGVGGFSLLWCDQSRFKLLWGNLHTNPAKALCHVGTFTFALMQSDTESPPPPTLLPSSCQPLTPEGQWCQRAAWNKYPCPIYSAASRLAKCLDSLFYVEIMVCLSFLLVFIGALQSLNVIFYYDTGIFNPPGALTTKCWHPLWLKDHVMS